MPNINDVFNVLEEIGQRWNKEYPRIQVSTSIALKDVCGRHRTFVELIYENGTFFTCDELTDVKQPMVVSLNHYTWDDILPHLVKALENIKNILEEQRSHHEYETVSRILPPLLKFRDSVK